MNFQHMPELAEPWGYPAALGLMATIVIGTLVWFRQKGWIGSKATEIPSDDDSPEAAA
jgi:hypothetical protein